MLRSVLPLQHIARPPTEPIAGDPPMLLLLHGVGSDERDMFELAGEFDPRLYILSLRGPHALGADQYGWCEVQFTAAGPEFDPAQMEASRQMLSKFIERSAQHYGGDSKRVYLFGFSQGATLSLTLLLTDPDPLAGVISVAGRVPHELFLANTPLSGKLSGSDALKGIQLFLGHGIHDQVLPVAFGRQAEDLLSRAPLEMTYREYEMAHEINGKCLSEIDLWLRTQLSGG